MKDRIKSFLGVASYVMVMSIVCTPFFTGVGGVVLKVYLHLRYKFQFDIWSDFMLYASKGVSLGVIIGGAICFILLFHRSH